MNFFRSILSDDPDPPKPEIPNDSERSLSSIPSQGVEKANDVVAEPDDSSPSTSNPNSSTGSDGSGWSFGGLIKTFATRSESVLETYRRDLEEFGSGLKKETQIFREVASRAVKELPTSIEAGASVAHGSLESFSHAIDGVIKSTTEIISQGKESILSPAEVDSDILDTGRSLNSGRYSRFDAQLATIQNDVNTFCEEPEEIDDYKKWKSGFTLEEKSEEIENLIGENGALGIAYKKLVPNVIDRETFFYRYFYRVHRLKRQENVRANLVKRAISVDDEEELSWDVDDDSNEEDTNSSKLKHDEHQSEELGKTVIIHRKYEDAGAEVLGETEENKSNMEDDDKSKDSAGIVLDGKLKSEGSSAVQNEEDGIVPDGKSKIEGDSGVKNEGEAVKSDAKEAKASSHGENTDVSVVSKEFASQEEEDLEWDEIEDVESINEKKVSDHGGSPNRADLRKRLSAADEEEDLSWDIEDDDEPMKG